MTDFLASTIADQLEILRQRVEAANTRMNIDGMFARYVSSFAPEQVITWDVDETAANWEAQLNATQFAFSLVGALGFQISSRSSPELLGLFNSAIVRLQQKEPYPSDRFSLAFHAAPLLGIALATRSMTDPINLFDWVGTLIRERPNNERSAFSARIEDWVLAIVESRPRTMSSYLGSQEAGISAAITVALRAGFVEATNSSEVAKMQADLMRRVCVQVFADTEPKEAATIWAATSCIVGASVSELLLSRLDVPRILRRFPSAMRRWRWDNDDVKEPIRWIVRDEREVQDIVWIMLRSVFDDVVDEETLPKVGHASSRADFGIRSLRLLIEIKYCRSRSDFKKIENEIIVDAFRYLAASREHYDKLLVFVYDASASVQEHDISRTALMEHAEILDVIIVSRPSQLPGPASSA